MENPDTLVLNLTFLGTVGVAFLMAFILFLLGVITLVLAGMGRLAAVILMGLFGRRPRKDSIPLVQLYGTRLQDGKDGSRPARKPRAWPAALKPARVKSALRTAVERHPALVPARREHPVLAEDWASAVAEADARAIARARAAVPEIKLSVRDLPDPKVPANEVVEVAPLVESALDDHRPHEAPRSFTKPPHPATAMPLDTGSLVSLSAPQQVLKEAASNSPAGNGKKPLP